MAVPQTQKQVGAGGCITSIVILLLSVVAFIGGLVFAFSGVASVANDLTTAPGIDLGDTGTVNVNTAGTQSVLLGNKSGSNLPVLDPPVSIKDPSGNNVPLDKSLSTTSGESGSSSFRLLGTFNAASTGAYEITVGGSSSSSARVYILSIDVQGLVSRIVIGFGVAFGLSGLLFVIALILGIVWLVRRSKSKKSSAPPYQGGGYPGAGAPGGYPGGPPPGPGGYGSPPPGPAGGYGSPPPGPAGGYSAPPAAPPSAPQPGSPPPSDSPPPTSF